MRVVVCLTLLICFFSLAFTCVFLQVFEGSVGLSAILISVIVPSLSAPGPVILLSNIILKLDKAEENLHAKNLKLENALEEVKELSGLLPICAGCKKIRDDKGYWNQIETYIEKHSKAEFSHGLCEACLEKMYGTQEWYKKTRSDP